MKKFGWFVVAMMLVSSVSAFAQSPSLARVNIPFKFVVHEQVLPAGTYELSRLGDNALRLRSVESNDGITMVTAQSVAKSPTVTFKFLRGQNAFYMTDVITEAYQVKFPQTWVESKLDLKAEAIAITVHRGL